METSYLAQVTMIIIVSIDIEVQPKIIKQKPREVYLHHEQIGT